MAEKKGEKANFSTKAEKTERNCLRLPYIWCKKTNGDRNGAKTAFAS